METAKAQSLVRKFYKMMESRKLAKAETYDETQLYRTHFCDIGFKVEKPKHMKRGSVVMQISRIPDKEIVVNVTVYETPEDFKKWLDYQVL